MAVREAVAKTTQTAPPPTSDNGGESTITVDIRPSPAGIDDHGYVRGTLRVLASSPERQRHVAVLFAEAQIRAYEYMTGTTCAYTAEQIADNSAGR